MRIPLAAALFIALSVRLLAGPNPVLDWNRMMIDAVRNDNTGPTTSTRNLAIMNVAIYDAVNSIARTHQPYAVALPAPEQVSLEAAATGAARSVLLALYPHLSAHADGLYQNFLAGTPANAALTNGLALGGIAAQLALADRQSDGSNTQIPYIPSDAPGQWRRTPPFFRPPLTPHWRHVTPFGIQEIEPFVAPPPPALDSPEYAASYNEVKRIGASASVIRTKEQAEIATFWSDFSYTSMPPGHWHLIAADICEGRAETVADCARLFALLSIVEADAAIVCWEGKFRYNLWRPVTAIQRATEDGNPLTEADPAWNHLLPSPPFPSYPSGHSTFSKAAATILGSFYGTDTMPFVVTSDSLPDVVRRFESFSACAHEIGRSRIYGGFHFSFDDVQGKASGDRIARFVGRNLLLANDRLPLVLAERNDRRELRFRLHAKIGTVIELQQSSDLRHWTPISTNAASLRGVLTGPVSDTARAGFFRVKSRQMVPPN